MGRLSRGDWILILTLTLAAAGLGIWLTLRRTPGRQVTVRLGQRVLASFPLEENREYTIEDGYGGVNHLVIQDGIACIDEANCPDRICVLQGAVSQAGEAIVCLPHEVVVEITQ
jgi:hypothetical protein